MHGLQQEIKVLALHSPWKWRNPMAIRTKTEYSEQDKIQQTDHDLDMFPSLSMNNAENISIRNIIFIS